MRDGRYLPNYVVVALALMAYAHAGLVAAEDTVGDVDVANGAYDFLPSSAGPVEPRAITQPWAMSGNESAIGQSDVERLRADLVPAFLSFNLQTSATHGLRGSAGVSFPLQLADSCLPNCNTDSQDQNWATASADARDLFFDGAGPESISVGRTLNLFQRRNAFTTRDIPGAGSAFGRTPRFEAEAGYAANIAGGAVNFWLKGMYQETELQAGDDLTSNAALIGREVTASGVHLGTQATFGALQLEFSYFEGEALGNTFLHDTDALDSAGNERNNAGFVAQGIYSFGSATKVGISFGETTANETRAERSCRSGGSIAARCNRSLQGGGNGTYLETQTAWSLGVYHDVTSWLKIVAEYTNSDTEWHGGEEQEVDTFAVGGYFFW